MIQWMLAMYSTKIILNSLIIIVSSETVTHILKSLLLPCYEV